MERVYKWLYHFGQILDGVIGVTTLCTVNTSFALSAAVRLSNYRYKQHSKTN